jgi:hypothetical protein
MIRNDDEVHKTNHITYDTELVSGSDLFIHNHEGWALHLSERKGQI